MAAPRRTGPAPIRLLQFTTFVSTFDRFVMPPMLIAIAHDLDVPLSQVVSAAGAYFLAYGLAQPAWGIISDLVGLVRTMRLALLLAALSTAAGALVSTPLLLAVARGSAGIFFGAAYPGTLVYLGDTVPADHRHRQIADLMVGVALGTASASLLGGAIAALLSWRIAFLLTGTAAVVLAVVLGRLPEAPRIRQGQRVLGAVAAVSRSGAAVFVLGLAFAEGAVLLGVLTVLPPAVEASGASAVVAGAVTAVYGVAVFGFARLVGRWSGRVHPARLIGIGATAALLACLIMAMAASPGVALVVVVLLGLAWAAMHSSLQTWATEVLPEARATLISLFATALFAGSALAALLVAGLAEAERYDVVFGLAAAAVVPLGVAATWGRARWRRAGGPV